MKFDKNFFVPRKAVVMVLTGIVSLLLSACQISSTRAFPTFLPTQTTTDAPGQVRQLFSPNRQWLAKLDLSACGLEIEDPRGNKQPLFPSGSTVTGAEWSPDSTCLAVVLSHLPEGANAETPKPPSEIQLVSLKNGQFSLSGTIYRAEGAAEPSHIVLGAWSPDSRQVLFWLGTTSASMQMDGLPLYALDGNAGTATRLADKALTNPAYQSWAPDGSALVFTNGGYRSAQIGKWLSLYDVASGQTTTLVAQDELVPGQVAWSPAGDEIAFAAVEAGQTGLDWADYSGWDNPAILARRIYLLDLSTRQYQRLNDVEAYQDAPRWSPDGKILYFVQMEDQQARLMAADPDGSLARPVAESTPVPLPEEAGIYGQVDWSALERQIPAENPDYVILPQAANSTVPAK